MNRRIYITLEVIVIALVIVILAGSLFSSNHPSDAAIWVLFMICGIIGALSVLKQHNSPVSRTLIGILGFSCVFISIFTLLSKKTQILPETQALLLTFGLVMIVISWKMRGQNNDFGRQDERSQRIGTYGISCSWYLTYILVVFLCVAIYTQTIILETPTVLIILIILMPVSTVLFQWYYNRKGDLS
jgi:peptidoglycan/LPS O-acetylase OafA/YrhL